MLILFIHPIRTTDQNMFNIPASNNIITADMQCHHAAVRSTNNNLQAGHVWAAILKTYPATPVFSSWF
jgi:hypothetical protein